MACSKGSWALRTAVSVAGITAGAMSMATMAIAQSAAPAAQKEENVSSEDIIVTASRRETTLRETPTAISAYKGADLAKQHIVAFTDLVASSPNVQLGSNDSNTNIAIRGIGNTLQTAGNDPGVAFYVDGIYLPDPALSQLSFLDVNRVEVLRGPQGTLFGRNATGGAINVISNTPTVNPSAGFQVSAGAPLGEQVQVFANTPLTADGRWLSRVAFEQTYQQGRLDNLAPTGPGRFDDKNNYAIRAQIEWRPTDTFSIRLQGDYQLSDTVGTAPYLVGSVSGILPPQLATTSFASAKSGNDVYLTHGETRLEGKGIDAFLNWDIGGGSLSATASRRDSRVFTDRDGDGTLNEFDETTINVPRETTTAELLYTSDVSKPFSFVVGANYYRDHQFQNLAVSAYILPLPLVLTGDVHSTSYAGFGQAQYKITSKWKLFAGLRYSHDHKDIFETNNFVGSLAQAHSWSKVTYEAGTSYDISRSATAYLKYATGYKSGGYSSGALAPAFRPEENRMLEAGFKGALFDRKLEANIALFHMSYSDLQVNQVMNLEAEVTNAAKATIYGAEVGLTARLTPELRLQLDGGWLHARFDEFLTEDSARPQLGTLNLKGNTLPQAPNFTLGGGPVYERSLANGARFALSARYDWKSRVYFSEFNLPVDSQKSAGTLSASVNYTLPDGHWDLGLYGRNLADARIFNSMIVDASILSSIIVGYLAPRREFGAQVRYHF
jgi:iron complex outermembrane receptor protein